MGPPRTIAKPNHINGNTNVHGSKSITIHGDQAMRSVADRGWGTPSPPPHRMMRMGVGAPPPPFLPKSLPPTCANNAHVPGCSIPSFQHLSIPTQPTLCYRLSPKSCRDNVACVMITLQVCAKGKKVTWLTVKFLSVSLIYSTASNPPGRVEMGRVANRRKTDHGMHTCGLYVFVVWKNF